MHSLTAPADDSRLVRAHHALWRAGDFGVIVQGARDATTVTIEGTGAALWDLLREPRTRSEIAGELAASFGVDPGVVAADVEPALDALLALGVLETVE